MKKLFVCMISIVMAAALAACGNKAAEGGKQTGDTGMSVSVEEETAANQEADGIETETEESTEQTTETAAADLEEGDGDAASGFGEADTENETGQMEENTMKITAGNTTFTATLEDSSSVEALKELLAEGPLTIDMSDYGNMEKVGPIGTSFPRNDEQITTEAGDIILYQGNSLVVYYDTNSWNFTRIGKIDGVTREDLLDAFGEGSVTVTFSLE